ncbi:MAG: hypothetical protein QXZ44_03460 [Ferroplasma sp.]
MSILPKRKHEPSTEEQLNENLMLIKERQGSMKAVIRKLLSMAQSIDAQLAENKEKGYDDLVAKNEVMLKTIQNYIKGFDSLVGYLDWYASMAKVNFDLERAVGVTGDLTSLTGKLKISPEMQSKFETSISEFTSMMEENQASMKEEVESINNVFGIKNQNGLGSEDMLKQFLREGSFSGTSEKAGSDTIDSELEKRKTTE